MAGGCVGCYIGFTKWSQVKAGAGRDPVMLCAH